MKLSEAIEEMQKLLLEKGDCELSTMTIDFDPMVGSIPMYETLNCVEYIEDIKSAVIY